MPAADIPAPLVELTSTIIAGAIEVHRHIGPGLLESAYLKCLVLELAERGLALEVERPLPLQYKNARIEPAYRVDLIVGRRVLVEVKAVERLAPIHVAQMIAYLRLSGCPVGLLINFNTSRLVDGIRRIVNAAMLPGGDTTSPAPR